MSNLKQPKAIIASLIFLVSFVTYWKTIAPTTSFWDCGEFIACSYIMGVPHPPGSPLYILIGRLFSLLPISADIGLRVNIMSPILSAFSAMFTFLIIVRLIEMWEGKAEGLEKKLISYAGGVIGALAFAFSDSQWFNSVEAEVYSGSIFFTAIVIWMILKWVDNYQHPEANRWLLLIFYLVGLALGVHLLNVLALPTMFLIMYFQREKLSLDSFTLFAAAGALVFGVIYPGVVKGIPWLLLKFKFVAIGALLVGLFYFVYWTIKNQKNATALALISLLLVLIGYSTYTTIYIRSGLNPAIDENDPDTPARFVSYLNREQYGDWSISDRRAPLWEYQIKKMYIRYFGWQFIGKGDTLAPDGLILETISFRGLWGLPFLLGLIGFIHHSFKDWRRASSIFVLFVMTGIAIVIYLNQEDPQPRERDYAYTGSFFAFALWIGIGASAVLEFVREGLRDSAGLRRLALPVVAGLLVLAVPGRMFAFNYHEHNRTGEFVAYDYSYNILQTCEPNGIIFTNGDNDTFPLWFLQYVKGVRTDVRVINLSLLNTPWYIKQLRDYEPKVPISLSDEQIDALQPMSWPDRQNITIGVPAEARTEWIANLKKLDSTYVADDKSTINFSLAPTLRSPYGQGIRVQDMMIIHILSENKFRLPVYFAVTVSPENKINLDEYMRMDGLAFRVLPVRVKQERIDPNLIRENLFVKYQYRNLNNPDIYFNDNILALLGNYRSAFLTLAQYYQYHKQMDESLAALDKMSELMPENIITTSDFRLNMLIGQLYQNAGRPEELKKRLDYVVSTERMQPADKARFLVYYGQMAGDYAAAESLALDILKQDPTVKDAYQYLVNEYRRQRRFSDAVAMAQQWMERDPAESKLALNALSQLKSLEKADSLAKAADSTLKN